MNIYGRTNCYEFLGDRVVYCNLQPADPNLPRRDELAVQAGLPTGNTPCKAERQYASLIVHLL